MGFDTEPGRKFMTRAGRVVRHVEKHQGMAMDYWYLDTNTDTEFDVRALPSEYLGADKDAVMNGDRAAHKRAIRRAMDDDYGCFGR